MPEYILTDIFYEFLCDLILDADDTLQKAKGIRPAYSRETNIANYIRQISRGSKLDRTLSEFMKRNEFYETLYGIYVRKFFANLLVNASEDLILITDMDISDPDTVEYAIDVSAYDPMFMTATWFFKRFMRRFIARDLTEMTRNIVDKQKPNKEPIMSLIRIVSVMAVQDALNDSLVNGVYIYRIAKKPGPGAPISSMRGGILEFDPNVEDTPYVPPTGDMTPFDIDSDSDSDEKGSGSKPQTISINIGVPKHEHEHEREHDTAFPIPEPPEITESTGAEEAAEGVYNGGYRGLEESVPVLESGHTVAEGAFGYGITPGGAVMDAERAPSVRSLEHFLDIDD